VRIPLIVLHPAGASGAISRRLVGQYDFAPTLLEFAGFPDVHFEASPGRSFADAVLDPDTKHDPPDAVFFEQEESRGLRTDRYAYWKRLEGFGDYSDPAYDLWRGGTSQGTPPKPDQWIRHDPLPWLRKYWADYVWGPDPPPLFEEHVH
jgi:arylsulfatase A-like enzyme